MDNNDSITDGQRTFLTKLLKERGVDFVAHAHANNITGVGTVDALSKSEASTLISAFVGDKPRGNAASGPVNGLDDIDAMLRTLCAHFGLNVPDKQPQAVANMPDTPQAQPEYEPSHEPF